MRSLMSKVKAFFIKVWAFLTGKMSIEEKALQAEIENILRDLYGDETQFVAVVDGQVKAVEAKVEVPLQTAGNEVAAVVEAKVNEVK